MNFASILVVAAIVLLLVLAVRYIIKKGPCAMCEDAKNCNVAPSCESGCSGCPMNGSCNQKE